MVGFRLRHLAFEPFRCGLQRNELGVCSTCAMFLYHSHWRVTILSVIRRVNRIMIVHSSCSVCHAMCSGLILLRALCLLRSVSGVVCCEYDWLVKLSDWACGFFQQLGCSGWLELFVLPGASCRARCTFHDGWWRLLASGRSGLDPRARRVFADGGFCRP